MAAMDAASEERVREHEEGLAALGAQYEERLAAAQRYAATAHPPQLLRHASAAAVLVGTVITVQELFFKRVMRNLRPLETCSHGY